VQGEEEKNATRNSPLNNLMGQTCLS